jgi:hypothetical protein
MANLVRRTMSNLLAEAINCDDGERAARIIQDALGIESDDVAKLLLSENVAGRPGAARPALSGHG